VEIQRNRVGRSRRVAALLDIANDVQLAVVPTGNVFYHTRELHRLHDIMVAIRHRTTLDGSHRVRNPTANFTCDHWKKSWRCSMTVLMLSPLHWPSPSAVRPST